MELAESMIGLSSSASKVSLIAFVLILAAVLGFLFGTYGADPTLLQLALVIVIIPIAFTLSMEWLVWISLVSVILIDTHLVPGNAINYLRFGPMGLLALQGITSLVNDRSKS